MNGIVGLLASVATDDVQLTVGGTVIMIISVGVVLGLMTFCMHRILSDKEPEKHHAPLDINTRDLDP